MGLFDNAQFDPTTYQSPQGGLLDRLLASVNATPTDPGAGFPSSPMDAQASAPQPQASPLAVGDYQMPRIGPAAAFTLPPGQLDPNTGEHVAPAAPTAAPVQQPAALATPAPSPDFGDHLMAGYQNMRHGGGLIGSIAAAVTGQRNDPEAEALQQQQTVLQRQYTALVNAGVPRQQAMLAVLNPEAAKVIIPQALANKQKFVQLKDGLGAEHPAFVDESNQTVNGVPVDEWNKKNGADTNGGGLGDTSKTGPEYLATLPPQQAGIVKAMVEGRQPPPSSFALSKPYWQNMIAAAQTYDPTFDATNWSGRVAGVRDFSAGKSSEMVRSANQTLQHVNALLDSADALHNGPYPSVNWVGNKFNEATGGGEPGAFLLNAHAVADEMGKVFKGANLSDSEIKAWADALSPNMSPAQQRAAIGKMTELLHGALDALDEKRTASIGQIAADKQGPIIRPAGQAVLQRIDQWLKAANSNAAPAGGTAPTGVKWSVVQ